jgi:carbamoyltransferase
MTAILGISAFYHDSAAALVVDGRIVAAAQEERFTRKKQDEGFPKQAIDYCLREAGLTIGDLDYVGFYEKPLRKFDRLLETYLAFAPSGYRSFRKMVPQWLSQKLHLPRELDKGLGGKYGGRYVFLDHHESHAASAFFPSPFDEAAILTLDGVGEWSTSCYGVGRGNRIELSHEIRFPHSLGLLYSAFTYYAGFKVNSGEYKVMGLAPYGEPRFKDLILSHLMDLKDDGSFRLDMSYFEYCQGLTMTGPKFHKLLGAEPRVPESLLTQREMDLAASVQAVTEEVMLRAARHLHRQTGLKNLVLAGGVALNCVGNGRVLREGPFENIWIQPAAGDAGGALGTATFIWHQLLDNPRAPAKRDAMQGSFLGPGYDDETAAAMLDSLGAKYDTCADDEELCDTVATLLSEEKVVAWFQGRMEFGPRALGARSILGDARSTTMQTTMNLKIKFRESFRPFAPLVLREYVDKYFEMRPYEDSPYMLLVAPVREEHRLTPPPEAEAAFGIEKLRYLRSAIPAVTHIDYSARVQTVDAERHSLLHRLMNAFHERTDCPVLVNTSFNVRGEPIVCTPEDAYRCFMATDMDVLVVGRHVMLKSRQRAQDASIRTRHLAQFQLD